MEATELIKTLIVQAPAIAILLYMLLVLYNDAKKERAELIEKIDSQSDKLDDLKDRIVRLEVAEFGDKSPTKIKPPTG